MTEQTQAVTGQVVEPETGLSVLSDQGLATFGALISTVPDAAGGGYESILEQVLSAQSVADLDRPWRSRAPKELVGVPLIISSVSKLPSDFAEGLGWFMVVRATVRATGEVVTFTTGAGGIIFQLAQACALEATNPGKVFPFTAIVREAKRATREGYFPQHLEIVR